MAETLNVPSSTSKKGRPGGLNVQIPAQRKASAASPAMEKTFTVSTLVDEETKDSAPAGSNAIIYKAYIPPEASEKEKEIHAYLDQKFAFTVDIKQMIEMEVKTIEASPRLRGLLNGRKQTMQSPNLMQRRKNKALNTNTSNLKEIQLTQAGCNTAKPEFSLKPERLGD